MATKVTRKKFTVKKISWDLVPTSYTAFAPYLHGSKDREGVKNNDEIIQ